jgi:hypothetical protein
MYSNIPIGAWPLKDGPLARAVEPSPRSRTRSRAGLFPPNVLFDNSCRGIIRTQKKRAYACAPSGLRLADPRPRYALLLEHGGNYEYRSSSSAPLRCSRPGAARSNEKVSGS